MDMIFISAQPDELYFHWQVELYLYQFSKHGIKDKCYAVFGYRTQPSEFIVNLAKKYNVVWYKDEREVGKYFYVPSIRPHLLKKFFKDRPELGKNVFYHDSDVFIVKMPKFKLDDDIGYLSDTISYIGYNYITHCALRYSENYPDLPKNDILTKMCECMEISEDLVKQNELNSGGAQYLLKNIDDKYWENAEKSGVKLYNMLKEYEEKYPIPHHIQSWTAGMWAELWEYWKLGRKTKIDPELAFSWATDTRDEYHKKNIFHLAGITDQKNVFFKGMYIATNVIKLYQSNKNLFDDISENSSTIEYTNLIKEYAGSKFIGKDEHWSGFYDIDDIVHFGKNMWRSQNKKYIMFWNSDSWVITASQHENEISKTCGGYISFAEFP